MLGLPLKNEIIVLSLSAEEVEQLLWLHTYPVEEGALMPDKPEIEFLFNGWVKHQKFKLSRKIRSPENFLPIMKGRIEETSLGSLVFVQYSLFFSSIFFLVFWSVVTLFLSIFFIVFYNMVLYGIITFGVGVTNYVVAVANFNIQVKKSSRLLHDMLNGDERSGR